MLTKFIKAFNKSRAFKGDATRRHILANLTGNPDDTAVLQTLTAKQLTAVINVANYSYHDGQTRCKAKVEDDCLWIGGEVNKLIPLEALSNIQVTKKAITEPKKPTAHFPQNTVTWFITHYTLDYKERH